MGFRLVLTGVGAMNSPRFALAGLLVEFEGARVMLDGGPAAALPLDAWLVSDRRAELIGPICREARRYGLEPDVPPSSSPSRLGRRSRPHVRRRLRLEPAHPFYRGRLWSRRRPGRRI